LFFFSWLVLGLQGAESRG